MDRPGVVATLVLLRSVTLVYGDSDDYYPLGGPMSSRGPLGPGVGVGSVDVDTDPSRVGWLSIPRLEGGQGPRRLTRRN